MLLVVVVVVVSSMALPSGIKLSLVSLSVQ
jgi:hypothetical protein